MKLCQVTSAIVISLIIQINGNELSNYGRRLVQHVPLMTNGMHSKEGDWPWHAAIYYINNTNSSYKCGGTLLTPNTILTAAHCVTASVGPEKVLISLGIHDLRVTGNSYQAIQVFNITRHPNFDAEYYLNDIAIVRLSSAANLSDYVQPIRLWDSNRVDISDVTGKLGIVIGWGLTETDELSDVLRYAFMPVIPFMQCLKTHRTFFGKRLSDTNFCAGFQNDTSACNGDSGGSMTFEENGVYYIRGIVSSNPSRQTNSNLCDPNHYVLFTDVAQYLPWIEEVVPEVKPTQLDTGKPTITFPSSRPLSRPSSRPSSRPLSRPSSRPLSRQSLIPSPTPEYGNTFRVSRYMTDTRRVDSTTGCWWTSCQLYTWEDRGCFLRNDKWRQISSRSCNDGDQFYCCPM